MVLLKEDLEVIKDLVISHGGMRALVALDRIVDCVLEQQRLQKIEYEKLYGKDKSCD
jgi:hypothetical protein